jgi:hypothetical protein
LANLMLTQTSIRTAVLISPDESRWYNMEDQSLVETGGGGCILGWLGECGAVTGDFSSCNYICCMWKQPTLIPDFFLFWRKRKTYLLIRADLNWITKFAFIFILLSDDAFIFLFSFFLTYNWSPQCVRSDE